MTWKEKVEQNKKILDTIPIYEIYRDNECDTISDLEEVLYDYIYENNIELPEEYGNFPVNYLDSYEFMYYLHKRYPNFFWEEETICHIYFYNK